MLKLFTHNYESNRINSTCKLTYLLSQINNAIDLFIYRYGLFIYQNGAFALRRSVMKSTFLIFFILFATITQLSNAQGKIYSKAEIEIYGNVLQEVKIPVEYLQGKSFTGSRRIYFCLENNSLEINADSATPKDGRIWTGFSTALLRQFISESKSLFISVQKREAKYKQIDANVITISNGVTYLEFGTICPPYCD